jgi:hypothetical protein
MCDSQAGSCRERLLPRPKWATLYSLVVLGASSAAAVEMFGPAGALRTALRLGVVIGGSVAITLWLRLNRVALDAEDWCACAHEKMTVRVIRSAPPFSNVGVPGEPQDLEILTR